MPPPYHEFFLKELYPIVKSHRKCQFFSNENAAECSVLLEKMNATVQNAIGSPANVGLYS